MDKQKLYDLQTRMSAYEHAMGLISYDAVTTAPKGTASNRERTLAVLSEESYKLSTGSETVELLEELSSHKDELTDEENRMVYLLSKDLQMLSKIPMEEYVAYQQLLVQADAVWHEAKEKSDFASFLPYLEKIFETNKRFALYCAPDKDPYDFWLNEYEEGLDKKTCDEFFAELKSRLIPIVKKAAALPEPDDGCLIAPVTDAEQEAFSRFLMKTIGLDLDHCGFGTTEHPFTTSLGSHLDERITTHYNGENFTYSMFSVIHEGGHALYDTGSKEEYAFTVLDGGVSMGIHESQSRFYENILGRSRAFSKYIFPYIKQFYPGRFDDLNEEDYFKAINRVKPSLIRTEADEVTYCLHVMVRYELEKRIMAGELEVRDLPAEWNRLYKEYLGVDVPNDRCGVLQDSHWSGGAVGYFPSYALGSAYGAQFMKKMRLDVDVDACLAKGDFKPINDWNREKIWQHGSFYTPKQLLDKVLGENFDPAIYVEYLEKKCKEVYGI